MPNTKSAIRRVRRVKKQTQINRIRKSKYKIKIYENLLEKQQNMWHNINKPPVTPTI